MAYKFHIRRAAAEDFVRGLRFAQAHPTGHGAHRVAQCSGRLAYEERTAECGLKLTHPAHRVVQSEHERINQMVYDAHDRGEVV